MNENKKRILKNVVSSILVVLIFFFSFVALVNICFNALYIITPIRGYSMRPTLNSNVTSPNQKGDIVYINRNSSVTNNDIVVASVSWHEYYIIKRVIGKPGDKIQIKDETTHYTVYVNDKPLYSKDKTGSDATFPRSGSVGYYADYLDFLNNAEFSNYVAIENGEKFIQLGEHDYFLMGDNWGHTTDSIAKGPVKTKELIGKVDFVIDVKNKNPFTETMFFMKKLFSKN